MKYLMNPATGSVDTESNWLAEGFTAAQDGLIEVILADGQTIPPDFNPARSAEFEWIEA